MDLRLKKDFTMVVGGSSGSGKSIFTFNLVKDAIKTMRVVPSSIIICYGCEQPFYNNFKCLPYPLTIKKGMPDFVPPKNSLLILDDLQEFNKDISLYFSKYSHHWEISVLYITQNIFLKDNRNITIKSNYIVYSNHRVIKHQYEH